MLSTFAWAFNALCKNGPLPNGTRLQCIEWPNRLCGMSLICSCHCPPCRLCCHTVTTMARRIQAHARGLQCSTRLIGPNIMLYIMTRTEVPMPVGKRTHSHAHAQCDCFVTRLDLRSLTHRQNVAFDKELKCNVGMSGSECWNRNDMWMHNRSNVRSHQHQQHPKVKDWANERVLGTTFFVRLLDVLSLTWGQTEFNPRS
jgi:hypothetical protein